MSPATADTSPETPVTIATASPTGSATGGFGGGRSATGGSVESPGRRLTGEVPPGGPAVSDLVGWPLAGGWGVGVEPVRGGTFVGRVFEGGAGAVTPALGGLDVEGVAVGGAAPFRYGVVARNCIVVASSTTPTASSPVPAHTQRWGTCRGVRFRCGSSSRVSAIAPG